ncbi:hypothetical protein T484DRAFT_1922905, partial [Baffinella frigidus]
MNALFCTHQVLDTDSAGRALVACPVGTYAAASLCAACPGTQTSSAGATSVSECGCAAGTYLDAASSQCAACPGVSFSPFGSTQIENCACPEGHHGSNGTECVQCPHGFLKDVVGDAACTPCPGGNTSSVGATSASECNCFAGSYRDATSSLCTPCPEGLTSSAGETSVSECYLCPAGTYEASSLCVSCPGARTSSQGASDASECYCPAGTYLDATSSQCLACPGVLTTSVGATSPSNCSCPAGVFTNCDLNLLLVEHAPHSVYVAEAWDGSATLPDLSGNGRHAVLTVEGTVATATASGDGAANAVTFISGTASPATKLLWPESSIPGTFTVCSVTRYTGGTRQRLLTCEGGPSYSQSFSWIHGQSSGRSGWAYYGTTTAPETNVGGVDDWLVMCGTNGAGVTFPGNII